MSLWFKNVAVVSVVLFATGIFSLARADEKEQTCVKTNMVTASKSTLPIGEGHELTQEVNVGDIKYSNPDFGSAREWAYVQTDSIGGSGKLSAYFVDYFEDGNQTYGRAEGINKITTNSDGSWEANWQGTYRYLGGTGKFKDIKGDGTFKGGASSTEPAKEECQEKIAY
jgi:hypothetical protein